MHKDTLLLLLTPDRLDAIARLWGGSASDLTFIRAMENFVYAFRRGDSDLILRLTHSTHRSRDEVVAELEFVDYLAHQGVDVAHPVPAETGRLIETFPAPGSEFHAAVFRRAPGHLPDLKGDPATVAALHEDWGAMMGRMHQAIPTYRDGHTDPRRHVGYEDDITGNCRHYLPAEAGHLADILADLLRELQTLPRGPGQFGLLHTDCHHGNFHVDGRRLTLFDFDDCCHTWFAYDLAVPLWHFPVPERGQDPDRDRAMVTTFFRRFLAGYSRHHRFDPAWRDQLPQFFRLRDLQLFVFAHKMKPATGFEPEMQDFMHRRQALIESGRPSVEIDWSAADLPTRN